MNELQKVMADPSVRFFTKRILTQCRELDPVDALHDLELALETWKKEVDGILEIPHTDDDKDVPE